MLTNTLTPLPISFSRSPYSHLKGSWLKKNTKKYSLVSRLNRVPGIFSPSRLALLLTISSLSFSFNGSEGFAVGLHCCVWAFSLAVSRSHFSCGAWASQLGTPSSKWGPQEFWPVGLVAWPCVGSPWIRVLELNICTEACILHRHGRSMLSHQLGKENTISLLQKTGRR